MIESEDGQTLIIVDIPAVEKDEAGVVYSTLPMGIVVTDKHIITVCLKETSLIRDLQDGLVKDVRTQQRTRFILNILLLVAKRYLQYLKQIDKTYNYMESQLYKSQRNKELIQMLDLEKSLVYINTSLKANEVTLEKILRGRIVTLYEEDHDLLEDVLIEVRQAIEMAQIYSSIISGMMDAFASVISNNLNVTMKILSSITILMAIPNIIFGFYGMRRAGAAAGPILAVPAGHHSGGYGGAGHRSEKEKPVLIMRQISKAPGILPGGLLCCDLDRCGDLPDTGRAEAAGPPLSIIQLIRFLELGGEIGSDDQLGNAVAAHYGAGFVAVVIQGHHQLSPVIRVDDAHLVGRSQALLGGQAGAGVHQPHIALGNG